MKGPREGEGSWPEFCWARGMLHLAVRAFDIALVALIFTALT
jgi:hypothetical protein